MIIWSTKQNNLTLNFSRVDTFFSNLIHIVNFAALIYCY